MKKHWKCGISFALFVALLAGTALAQPPQRAGSAFGNRPSLALTGQVYDSATDKPVGYATFVLYSLPAGEQVTGTITDEDGEFILQSLGPGLYYAQVDFLGYASQRVDSIRVSPRQPLLDLGRIALQRDAVQLEDVDYVVTQSPVEYQIDRKVVRVDKQATAASGTAVDVLENVPSVSVDIEGNVSLRGSENFRVLIDGRPSVLDASDALEQVPASTIENIEIITNPSAKYDPEGTSGIINIVLKKQQRALTSGLVSFSAGSLGEMNGDAQVSVRNHKWVFTLGANYGERIHKGDRYMENVTTLNGITTSAISDGSMNRSFSRSNVKGNILYSLTDRDKISLGGRWGQFSMVRSGNNDYDTFVDTSAVHSYYISSSDEDRVMNFSSINGDYSHTFNDNGHELMVTLQTSHRDGDENSLTEQSDMSGVLNDGRKTIERGPASRLDGRVDYTLPINESNKLEAGYQVRGSNSTDETVYSEYVPGTGYVDQPAYSNTITYDRLIQSLWTTYSTEFGRLGVQGGFRWEYTDRNIELPDSGLAYSLNQSQVYPSLHTSWKLTEHSQLMASYSRRIDRPRGWHLAPIQSWIDAYNVRQGNPDLKPELIDSWEAGYQMPLGPFHHSTEFYYRVIHDYSERVRTVYAEGVTLHTIANVGERSALGAEMMFVGDLARWWNVNLMGNFYQNKITINGDWPGENTNEYSWSSRLMNTFRFSRSLKLQISGMYNSPRISSQGERAEFFAVNAAVEKTFLDRAFTATLQVRDIFQTMKFSMLSEGENLYSYTRFDIQSPIVYLTLKYNFNHFAQERRGENGNGDDAGMSTDIIE